METNATFDFLARIHEITSNADTLIKIYTEAYAVMQAIPAPEEMLELTQMTVDTLLEMKVALTMLSEHSAQVDDMLDTISDKLKDHLDKKQD
ncbi:hypothetical protein SEA_LEWANDO_39 [Arthrobacter phage Lewando]|nr:hypothetical protein SEA_LEWANDO_39 [Arthrobacter phage Lewando]